jgi:Flp pilus assembly protein TadG
MPASWFRTVIRALPRHKPGTAGRPRVSSFFVNTRAATAVEFAILAAPMVFTLMEVLQSALFVYFAGQLDHATQDAARQILTGSMQNSSLTASQFQTQVLCPLLPSVMSCNNVTVNLQAFTGSTYPSGFTAFVNSSETAVIIPTQTVFCPGTPQQYVYLQVYYAMPLFGNVWLPVTTTTNNGQVVKLIGSSAAFRNEPYQATSATPYSTTYTGC